MRCLHCGYVRAKNTTRQIEHLNECRAYQDSPDAREHAEQARQAMRESLADGAPSILNGTQPNPNLQVHRRGPNQKRSREGQPIAPARASHGGHGHTQSLAPSPSLTAHLLAICAEPFAQATQQQFLSHAGCGSLAQGPLQQWLVQDGHYQRGYIRFVGGLLAKLNLTAGANTQFHPMWRTMDLLISALNNMRREMQFFDITATKYGLHVTEAPPTPITRGLLDLFVSASSPSSSLLEGMVVLWGTEHCYRSAWQYASSFTATLSTPSIDGHILALHQALIPNWTAPAFSKFIDATRGLVDELANNFSARDGKEEMMRCEQTFRQICWLMQRFWPEVDGMGEEDETAHVGPANLGHMGGGMDNGLGSAGMTGSAMNSTPMNTQNMGVNGPNMGSGNMGGGNMNGSDGTPMPDNRNSYGGMDGVGNTS